MNTRAHIRGREAFAELFEQERRRALRLAYALTGDTDLADEIVSDVFIAMYPHWQKGAVTEPTAYLRRAIVNKVNSTFRHREVGRRAARFDRVETARPADTGLADRDAVIRALQTLPTRQRAAVALRYLDDLSEAETARVLDVSVGTVKAQVSRGLERLRAILEGVPEGEAR